MAWKELHDKYITLQYINKELEDKARMSKEQAMKFEMRIAKKETEKEEFKAEIKELRLELKQVSQEKDALKDNLIKKLEEVRQMGTVNFGKL